jgi:hypothetical protein
MKTLNPAGFENLERKEIGELRRSVAILNELAIHLAERVEVLEARELLARRSADRRR